jgi:hypothetical protein
MLHKQHCNRSGAGDRFDELFRDIGVAGSSSFGGSSIGLDRFVRAGAQLEQAPIPRIECNTAKPQLAYPESRSAEWILHREKSTLKNAREGYINCGLL